MEEISRKRREDRRLRLGSEKAGLAIPRHERRLLQGYLYKQEVNSPEEAPRVSRWDRVFCVLYRSVLGFYRSKDDATEKPDRPLDILRLDGDFLVRKIKASSKSAKPSKYKREKARKEMFLVTDLEHTNHYYASSSADVKTKWVEKLQMVISGHQHQQLQTQKQSKRNRAAKERLSRGQVRGSGMSRRERKSVKGLNSEIQRSLEDLQLMKDGWRDEAMRLRQELSLLRQKAAKKEERLDKSVGSVKKLVTELEVRGQEQELQAFETQRQREQLRRLKKRYYESSSSSSVGGDSSSCSSFNEVELDSESETERETELKAELQRLRNARKEKELVLESFY